MEDWERQKSTKLEALVTILQHHLARDTAEPLVVEGGSNNLIPGPPDSAPRAPNAPRDKIVVFTVFPSNLDIVEEVSNNTSEYRPCELTVLRVRSSLYTTSPGWR